MNDERLKGMRNIGDDYFDELLELIRDIRASEKDFIRKSWRFMFYQSILNLNGSEY